jgi:hypothetical protein
VRAHGLAEDSAELGLEPGQVEEPAAELAAEPAVLLRTERIAARRWWCCLCWRWSIDVLVLCVQMSWEKYLRHLDEDTG